MAPTYLNSLAVKTRLQALAYVLVFIVFFIRGTAMHIAGQPQPGTALPQKLNRKTGENPSKEISSLGNPIMHLTAPLQDVWSEL